MAVSFNAIPGNLRVPLFYAEVNAGYVPTVSPSRLLLIGGMQAVGTATPNQPVLVNGRQEGLFGINSMLATMVIRASIAAPFQEIWALPLLAGGVSQVFTVNVAASFTGIPAGLYVVNVGDVRVTLYFDPLLYTTPTFATALAAAINLAPTEFVAVATATGVTLTSAVPGAFYSRTQITPAYLPSDAPMSLLLTPTVTATTAGTDPVLTAALVNLAADEYDFIACPYNTPTSRAAVTALLAARWNPLQQLYGAAISFIDDTVGNLQTVGLTLGDPNLTVYGAYNMQSTGSAITASAAAIHAAHLQYAPELSRPLQTLALPSILGPKMPGDKIGPVGQNTLLYSGISTLTTQRNGAVQIGRAITTYQKDVYGNPDQSFLSPNTRAQLVYGIRYMRQYISSVWGRAALVDANPGGLQNFCTTADLNASVLHSYQNLCNLGVFDQFQLFAANLIVERDQTDPSRVNAYLPFAAVNQLTVFAANVTSYLTLAA